MGCNRTRKKRFLACVLEISFWLTTCLLDRFTSLKYLAAPSWPRPRIPSAAEDDRRRDKSSSKANSAEVKNKNPNKASAEANSGKQPSHPPTRNSQLTKKRKAINTNRSTSPTDSNTPETGTGPSNARNRVLRELDTHKVAHTSMDNQIGMTSSQHSDHGTVLMPQNKREAWDHLI
jgi:hypothetical protein